MKKTFAVKLFAVLMAATMVFAGCSSKKTNSEDEEVFEEKTNKSEVSLLSSAVEAFEKKSEQLQNFDYDNLAVDADVEITLGESFGEFIDLVSGTSSSKMIDESGLNSAKVSADFDRNGDVFSLSADAYVNDKLIVDADAVFDYFGEMLYVALPTLVDGTIGMDASELIDDFKYQFGETMSEFSDLYEKQLDVQKALTEGLEEHLSDEEVLAILEDYAEAGMAQLDEPEVEKTEISVDGIKQSVEAQIYEVTSEDAKNVCKVVLEKLYDDEQIKDKFLAIYPLVFDYLDVVSGGEITYYAESDAEEVYDDFLSEVEWLLDDLDDNFDGDEVVYITCYYDDDNFAGLSVENKEMDASFALYNVRNGNDVASSFNFNDEYDDVSIKLVGNDKGGMYNGVLTISPADTDSVSVRIENFDLNKFAEGSLCGAVALYGKDMPADVVGELPEGIAFKIAFDCDYLTYSNSSLIIELDGKSVIEADFNLNFSDDADKISVPDNYIDVEDQQAISEWATGLQNGLGAVMQNLVDAGVSQELLGMLVSNLL